MEFFYVLLVGLIIWYAVEVLLYRRTSYAKVTRNFYFKVLLDKGLYGEYLTYKCLRKYEKEGARFLFNCYLPRENGETTEIDVLMIHSSGIHVFESKNYSGWIFGSENQKTWTQTLPAGKKAHKEHFLNPIFQNKLHIKWLQHQVGDGYPVHSIIVFSVRCELKQVNITSPNLYVVNRNRIRGAVRAIVENTGNRMSQSDIDLVYEKLYSFTQVSSEVKEKHIKDIRRKQESEFLEESIQDRPQEQQGQNVNCAQTVEKAVDNVPNPEDQFCPLCGEKLVMRTARKGGNSGNSFLGCSNYPRCRFTKPIKK